MDRKTQAILSLLLCFLGLSSAEICFESYPENVFRVTELQGSLCVTVVRDDGDSDEFDCRAISIANLDASKAALEDIDFTAIPSGAVLGDTPPRYQTVTFAPNSTTIDICVTITQDLMACEEDEMFQIELCSPDACGGMNSTRLLVIIEDSTYIPMKFTGAEAIIKENEDYVEVGIVRENNGARNVKEFMLRVREDPNSDGCLSSGSFVTYGCQDFHCSDYGLTFDAFLQKSVQLPLLPDDAKVNGHRVCTVLMEGASQCKFNFTDGNKMKLVVEDDEYITVSFNVTSIVAHEDDGEVELMLESSVAVDQPFTVTIRADVYLDATAPATAGVDFLSGDYEVTFQAGEMTAMATIPLIDDNQVEFREDFLVSIVKLPKTFHVIAGQDLFVSIVDDESRNGRVRLVDGADSSEGHVEVLFALTWGRVCDDMWDILEGNVVCRQLGYRRAEQVYHLSTFGPLNDTVMWLDGLHCTGEEESLLECPGNPVGAHDCSTVGEAAGVRCTDEEEVATPKRPIRLADGANRGEGRVEVFINGQWGTICDDFWSMNNSNVACRQLGFSSATSPFINDPLPLGEGSIWLDDVLCTGKEKSLLECFHATVGVNNCGHEEDVKIRCNQTGVVCTLSCENGGTLDTDFCTCDCPQRFTGETCENAACDLVCQNGGTLDTDSCTCDCLPEFSGEMCETCTKACDNGGTLDKEACKCNCAAQFTGELCEVCAPETCVSGAIQDSSTCDCVCTHKLCLNGGKQDLDTCQCVCPPEYTGEFCENCVEKNCQNGGTQDSSTCDCVCPPEYTGQFCKNCVTKACADGATQDPATCDCVCTHKLCLNGGTQDLDTCQCMCLPEYTGELCENCVNKTCQNGGTQDSSTCDCVCPPEYTGELCEICVDKTCQNDGTQDSSTCDCVCPPEYTGEFCENVTCPADCSKSACKGSGNILCVIAGADSCGNPCGTVTTCKACYYSEDHKPLPDGCEAKLSTCPENNGAQLNNCLSKWGQCMKKKYANLYGKDKKSLKKNQYFKCFSPCMEQ